MNAKIFALFALLAVAYVTAECPAENGEHVVYLSNPENCTTFFVCDHGQAILRSCAEGTAWNAEEEVCDWPEKAGCVVEKEEEEKEEEVHEEVHEEAEEETVEEAEEKPVEEAALPPASPVNFPRTA